MPGTEYFLNEDVLKYFESKLDDKADAIINTASGSIAHFEDGAEADAVSVIAHIEPVQAGAGDPSPENIRPITGHTKVNVKRTGKNLVDEESVLGGLGFAKQSDDSWYFGYNYNEILGKAIYENSTRSNSQFTITFNYKYSVSGTIGAYLKVEYTDGTTSLVYGTKLDTWQTVTLTTDNSKIVDKVVWVFSSNLSNIYCNVQIELGSTATAYEPYQGETYTITFPTEAETVYGGYVDVEKGEMVVDRANIASYSGQTLLGEWISDRDVYTAGGTPTTGAQVVYKLAEPVVYNITPQQIALLLSVNNVWNDANGNTDVEYKADTKLYIEQLTKPTEA